MKNPIRIAVLISGNGSNLQSIIDHQKIHTYEYEIALVISNKVDAFGLTRAQNAQINTQVIDHTQFDSRSAFDGQLQKELESAKIDLIVLAGFMRILTPELTSHFLGKMINIHPSLLPKYTGLHTHKRALEAGDKEHGLSIHFVTPELDGGPVILQAKVDICDDDTEASLRAKVHVQEHTAYPLAIEWFAQGKLELKDNQVLFNQQVLIEPQLLDQTL
ncbi:MAG: phosphoribosylglycinamide formyltransferase 1 [Thiomicrorhabdus sp.]|nr:MAG: phosphoribosylglycinamide formyltransferase 1 [Thiomicrorhabdus sp.]